MIISISLCLTRTKEKNIYVALQYFCTRNICFSLSVGYIMLTLYLCRKKSGKNLVNYQPVLLHAFKFDFFFYFKATGESIRYQQ